MSRFCQPFRKRASLTIYILSIIDLYHIRCFIVDIILIQQVLIPSYLLNLLLVVFSPDAFPAVPLPLVLSIPSLVLRD